MAVVRASRGRVVCEALESRQLLSGAPVGGNAQDVLASAIPLRPIRVRSVDVAVGNVGGISGDVLYSFTVTAPINLIITMARLRQPDVVTLFFADGSDISQGTTDGDPIARFNQRLDPGTYFLDVAADNYGATPGAQAAPTGGALPRRRMLAPTTAYTLVLQGIRPDPNDDVPVPDDRGPGGTLVPTGGFGVEPSVNVANFAGWKDFSNQPLYGPNGPVPEDIVQGAVGDCYFLSSLSDVARIDPGLIQSDITPMGGGLYQVKFQNNGQDVVETVDSSLPVDGAGNPLFAHLGTGNSLWVAIMEKAFCFFRHPNQPPSYAAIDNGSGAEVFADLGGSGISSLFGYQFRTSKLFVAEVAKELAQGKAVVFGTIPNPYYLVPSHIYSVVQVNPDNSLMLRNPWGFNNGSPNDSGYINLTADQALLDLNGISSGTFPIVQAPTPAEPPVQDPTPTPPPGQITANNGYLGQDSFDLHNGNWGDCFITTANSTGTATISIQSTDFAPSIEVVQINADQTTTLVALDSNPDFSSIAQAQFSVSPGALYEVVLSSAYPAVGVYSVSISQNLGDVHVFTTKGFIS